MLLLPLAMGNCGACYGEPLVKWVEPRHYDDRTGTLYFESYWLFSSDYDTDLRCWVYEQHQVTLWEYLRTEIPPRYEGEP